VITMVTDGEALRAVTAGPDGVLAGLTGGGTLVQMSTVGVESTRALQASLPEQVGLLDAPVLGSVGEAESGTLKVFAGGSDALVRDLGPLLSVLGTVLPVGPVGMGTAAKLVANASLLGVVSLLGEVLSLADGLGLPTGVAHDVLATTPLAAQAERRRPVLESRVFPPRFALSLARKDADLIIQPDLDLRLLPAVRSWLVDAETAGSGGEDTAAVLATIIDAPRRL
ncbi:MAG: NAD(P)-dependent oxidoreductase, partial [Nocardioidaceae bacterium]